MLKTIISICQTPFMVFALAWSVILIIEKLIQKNVSRLRETFIEHMVHFTSSAANMLLQFSLVYMSALLFGFLFSSIVRWVILVLMFLVVMLATARTGAATEFTIRKTNKELNGLTMAILSVDIISFGSIVFGVFWMFKIFIPLGM